jgi:lysozyme family protein
MIITQAVFNAQILPVTLKHEGGYASVANDRGGETYRGISRLHNPTWSGWLTVDAIKPLAHNQIINSLEPAVYQFYYANYFANAGFNLLKSTNLALALFDFRVHGGYSASAFKRAVAGSYAVMLSSSSSITAADAAVLNRLPQQQLVAIAMKLRYAHLSQLLSRDASQSAFAAGWKKRYESISDAVGLGANRVLQIVVIVGLAVFASLYFLLPAHARVYKANI